MSRVLCILKTNQGGQWAIPQLREIRDRGHDVAVVIPPGDGRLRRDLDSAGITVIESAFDFVFRPRLATLTGLWRLRRQIRQHGTDTVFYHLYASALAARLATVWLRVRRVHMVPGPLYLDSTPIRAVERILCRMDDVVIGGSAHTADRYLAIGMPAKRVVAIPYGADPDRFSPRPSRRAELVPNAVDAFTVIMVAYVYKPRSAVYRGVGIKGHEVLLEAWSSIASSLPQAHLVLVGAGFDDDAERYRQTMIEKFGIDHSPNITWFPTVDDVRDFYASADLSVSPSLSENHGAALEASAMGLPSIVSDAGALPETVVAGETGWVVPAGDVEALGRSLRDAYSIWQEGSLDRMGLLARQNMMAKFSTADCARRVADVVLEHGP